MRLRDAALVLPFIALLGCSDDTTSPTMTRTTVKPNFDHSVDPAVARIAVNNYVVDVRGAAMTATYKGQSAIFNGNMAYGVSPTQVFHVNTANGATDFSSIGSPMEIVTDGSMGGAANFTSTFFIEHPTNALGQKTPLGIYTIRETYAYAGAPDDDYLIVKYSMTNGTAAAIAGLHTGMLLDPDVFNAATNISTLDGVQGAAIARNNSASAPSQHAVVLLNQPVGGYRSWLNGGDPTTNAAWYGIVSSGIQAGSTGPGDIRQYLGAATTTLQAGQTQVVAYALVSGDNASDLAANIAAARAKAAGLLAPRALNRIPVTISSSATTYIARLTFASAAEASKFDASTTHCASAPILTSLVTGSSVDVTFGALDIADDLQTGDKMFCSGRLTDNSYFVGYDTPQIDHELTKLIPLTHTTAANGTPSFSPDGSKIVFSSSRNGGGLFIMNVEGGDSTATQLTTVAGDVQADWSPDGTSVIFNRVNVASCPTCIPTFLGGIFKVDVATHAVTRLTSNFSAPATDPRNIVDSDPRYSPDGTRIAFRRFRGGSAATTLAAGNHIWLMGAAGDSPLAPAAPLVYRGGSDIFPEWSPDGSHIYFTSNGLNRNNEAFQKIFSVDVAIGEPSVVEVSNSEPIGWQFGAISPDGSTIVALSKAEIVFHDLATGLHEVPLFDPRVVTVSAATTLQNIEWSPSGDRFVFVADNTIFITAPKHLVTPSERAENLVSSVDALIDDGFISAADGEQLQSKLGDVVAKIEHGNLNAAVNNVNAFLNKVNALLNSRRVNTITADLLTTNANALIEQIQTP